MSKADRRVSRSLRWQIINRDGGCMAPLLDPLAGPCRDQWGDEVPRNFLLALTMEHVQDGGGSMGLRAPDDARHLVTLCAGHHLGTGSTRGSVWALANKDLSRRYLRHVNEVSA